RNTSTPLSSSASSTAAATPSSVASRSESMPTTSAPTEAVSLLMVSTLIGASSRVRYSSRRGLPGAHHDGIGRVDRRRLVHDLDRHRDHDQRVDQVQKVDGLLGHVVERVLVAVLDRLFQAGKERVVEVVQ